MDRKKFLIFIGAILLIWMIFSFTYMNKKYETKEMNQTPPTLQKVEQRQVRTQEHQQQELKKQKTKITGKGKQLKKIKTKKNLSTKIEGFIKSNIRQCPASIINNAAKFEWTGQYGHCEEKIYQKYFKNLCYGNILDVGACDGVTYSNSYGFEKNLKWKAILVEANPEYVEEMKKTRPNSIIVHAGAGQKEEELEFYPAGVLGGFVKSWSKEHWAHVKRELGTNFDIKKMLKVKILPLSKILKEHKMQVVDFMNLDAEGHELEVLQGIDWKWSKIRYIFIESYNGAIANYLKGQGLNYVVEKNQDWGPDVLLRLVE